MKLFEEFIPSEKEIADLKALHDQIKDRDDYEDVKAMIMGATVVELMKIMDENI